MKKLRIIVTAVSTLIMTGLLTAQFTYEGTEMYREIESDIRFLASDALEGRAAGERGEVIAAEYIAARLLALGAKPGGVESTFYQPFSVKSNNPHETEFSDSGDNTVNALNVMGFIDHGAEKTIVIGAHYDHLGYGTFFGSLHAGKPEIHNGADDNASGVAAMLQLAEICSGDSFKFANYLIIGFSGEERGLWGSNYYVKHPTVPLESIEYMINLDMVGRLNEERKISINGVGTSPAWSHVIKLLDVEGLVPVTTESGVGASDHTSFYFEDIPAVHFFTGQHSDYHKPSDDTELVNFNGVVSVVKYISTLIESIGGMDISFSATKDDTEPSARDFKVTLGVMPDYLYTEGGMRIDGVREDRPADNAGLEKGDVVIKMGDVDIDSMEDYMNALGQFSPDETIEVVIRRGDEMMKKKVKFD